MRILVIGDTHFPAVHPKYLSHLLKIRDKYKCTTVVHIGDVVDHNSISFHKKAPENDNAMLEYAKATKALKKYVAEFSKAYVCIGNHDERVRRLAGDAGIPMMYLKDYNEIYEQCPKWIWNYSHLLDGVQYMHGTGLSGHYPAFNAAKAQGCSVVLGHCHSLASINFTRSPSGLRVFGMNVGCGVDPQHPAMDYNRNHLRQPMLACGVVIDGDPYLEVM